MLSADNAVLSARVSSSWSNLRVTSTASSTETLVNREATSKLTTSSSGSSFSLAMISAKCLEFFTCESVCPVSGEISWAICLNKEKKRNNLTAVQEAKIGRTVRGLVRMEEISDTLYYNKLRPGSGCHDQPSRIYGLPKIHKPFRPIVSCINSYQLAKHITQLISPLTGQTVHDIGRNPHLETASDR